MRLRTIELDQFRKFDRKVRIDGLRDGVNVLCGPNELGKSTVLAALRAVLFEKHSSRTDSIRSYQHHRGSTAPSVSLEFEHDGTAHRIEKRFLSRPGARMVSGGIAYEGDAAEERLAGLLGVSMASRGSKDAAAQTASIWGALLVSQGASFTQAGLSEGARSTLSECLEAELGSVSGGAVIGRLLKQLQAPIAALLDGHGKPRDRYKGAILDRDAAAVAIETMQQRRRLLEADLAAVVTARRELRQEEDPVQAERAVEALAAARRHRDAVLGSRDKLEKAEAALRLAVSAHADANAEQGRRTERAARLAKAARLLEELAETEAEVRSRVQAAQAARDERRRVFDEAGLRQDAAERDLRLAAARLDAAEQAAARDTALARLAQAETEAARVADLSLALSRLRLDEDGLRALQQAELAHRGNQAALLAQATTVELSLEVAAELLVEGEPAQAVAPGDTRLSLTRPAELMIAGVGRLRILPAARDQDRLHATAQETARHLARALEAAGCADLVQAEKAVGERRRVQSALDQAQRSVADCLAGAVPGAPGGRARPDLEGLRRHVAELQAAVSERLAALGIAAPPDLASALAERLAAATREDQARQQAAGARHAFQAPEADLGVAEAALREAEFARRDREAECRRLSDEQAAAEAT